MKRVLIVDDDSMLRKLYQIFLSKFDVVSSTAENGQKALARIANCEEGFDLILTDIDMPEMNGIEMAQKLNGSKIPIIFVSGSESSLKKAKLENFPSFAGSFLKPVMLKDLAELIKKILA